MVIFADRAEAGRELASTLSAWRGADAVVLGIPRGGVVVAAEVARVLALPLGVAVVRKLGDPVHEEYAVGAIADGVRVVHPGAGAVPADALAAVEERERGELRRRRALFAGSSDDLTGRVALVVDDGIATGATATAACVAARARGAAAVVLAAPVAPERWRPPEGVTDEYICPHRLPDFWAVGRFYDDFTQTSDAEVVELLSRSPAIARPET